jgi:hypothetical protein
MPKVNLTIINGVTIKVGTALSTAVDCAPGRPIRIIMPTAWTPAVLTFQMSNDNINFFDLFDHRGKEVVIVCDGYSRSHALPPGSGPGVNYVKLRSGYAAKPVTQAADRVFSVLLDNTLV